MSYPAIASTGHYQAVRLHVPFEAVEVAVVNTAQKIKAAVVYAFQALGQALHTLFRVITWTYRAVVPGRGEVSYTYRLPKVDASGVQRSDKDPFIIITFDGGGVRGIASAAVAKVIEEEIEGSILDALGDEGLIGGTSTGGLIAAALAAPSEEDSTVPRYAAKDLPGLYHNLAPKIFANSFFRNVKSFWGAREAKYASPRETIEGVIGNVALKDSLAKNLLITSVDLLTSKLVLFENSNSNSADFLKDKHIKCCSVSHNATFADALVATSAAPTYFPTMPYEGHNLADGGIAENNPAQIATLIAQRNLPKDHPILVISIGTGKLPSEPITTKESLNWGWLQWISPLIDYFLDSKAAQADMQMHLMAENNPLIKYVRFQMTLEDPSEAAMDNASPENLKRLELLGTRCFKDFLDKGGRESMIVPLKRKLSRIK